MEDETGTPRADLPDGCLSMVAVVAGALVLMVLTCAVTVTSIWGRYQPW
jgi:hypothetical protein